jgi:1-phosphofructokinase family hexose kinase
MIVTLTPNTALDHTIVVERWSPGQTLPALDSALGPAGKPTDASYVLGELGLASLALGFVAGDTGAWLASTLRAKGVRCAFTPVGGTTRLNTVLIDRASGAATTVTTNSLVVSASDIAALTAVLDAALDDAACLVLGGSLPAGVPASVYADWISHARARGVPTIFDAAGEALRAGLSAGPDYVKPNRHELGELTGRRIASIDDAWAAGREIVTRYGTTPIVTLDADGVLAVTADGALRVRPAPVVLVSAAGAGDAVLAGLAASIARGQSLAEGLRLGVAAASAVCMNLATADCRREDVMRIAPTIQIDAVIR